jgi:hypothetical protein
LIKQRLTATERSNSQHDLQENMMDSLMNGSVGAVEDLKCWQRVWMVLSGIWVVLPLGALVVSASTGDLPSLAGVLLMLGIAFAPPALLYGIGAAVSGLVSRIRNRL